MKHGINGAKILVSLELRSAVGEFVYPVILNYLQNPQDLPKWIVIPSDLHTGS